MREKLFDRLRRRWVADNPEERIRQSVVDWMLNIGQYPESLLCAEKQLMRFEGMGSDRRANQQLPLRRFDLLCLRRVQGRLEPLLLLECKATRASEKAKKQVLDYNYHVGAPFVALACVDQCTFAPLMRPQLEDGVEWILGLPTHAALQRLLIEN